MVLQRPSTSAGGMLRMDGYPRDCGPRCHLEIRLCLAQALLGEAQSPVAARTRRASCSATRTNRITGVIHYLLIFIGSNSALLERHQSQSRPHTAYGISKNWRYFVCKRTKNTEAIRISNNFVVNTVLLRMPSKII